MESRGISLAPVSTPWWPDVMAIYGVLNGDTCYIRFRDYDDPDTCDLRAAEDHTVGVTLEDNDHITIENLRIQGSLYGVDIDNSDYNIIRN